MNFMLWMILVALSSISLVHISSTTARTTPTTNETPTTTDATTTTLPDCEPQIEECIQIYSNAANDRVSLSNYLNCLKDARCDFQSDGDTRRENLILVIVDQLSESTATTTDSPEWNTTTPQPNTTTEFDCTPMLQQCSNAYVLTTRDQYAAIDYYNCVQSVSCVYLSAGFNYQQYLITMTSQLMSPTTTNSPDWSTSTTTQGDPQLTTQYDCRPSLQQCSDSYLMTTRDQYAARVYYNCLNDVYCIYPSEGLNYQQYLQTLASQLMSTTTAYPWWYSTTTTTPPTYSSPCQASLLACFASYAASYKDLYSTQVYQSCLRNAYCPYITTGDDLKKVLLDNVAIQLNAFSSTTPYPWWSNTDYKTSTRPSWWWYNTDSYVTTTSSWGYGNTTNSNTDDKCVNTLDECRRRYNSYMMSVQQYRACLNSVYCPWPTTGYYRRQDYLSEINNQYSTTIPWWYNSDANDTTNGWGYPWTTAPSYDSDSTTDDPALPCETKLHRCTDPYLEGTMDRYYTEIYYNCLKRITCDTDKYSSNPQLDLLVNAKRHLDYLNKHPNTGTVKTYSIMLVIMMTLLTAFLTE